MSKVAISAWSMMGTPMAGRLVHAGHTLTVWDRSCRNPSPAGCTAD